MVDIAFVLFNDKSAFFCNCTRVRYKSSQIGIAWKSNALRSNYLAKMYSKLNGHSWSRC